MNFSQNRGIWMVSAAVFVVVLLAATYAGRERAPEVRFATATLERLEAFIASNGKVEPIVPHVLRAQLNSFVQRVHGTEGKAVRAGDVLLQLDDAEAAAEVARLRRELVAAQELLRTGRRGGSPVEAAQLETDLRQADADVARLRREHASLQRLARQQAATSLEVEQAKLALDRALDLQRFLQQKKEESSRQAALDIERGTLEVNRVSAALRLAEERLRSTRLTAPVSGTLYALPVREGQFVKVGDLLAEVADLGRVRVRAFVDEPEMGALAEGQDVDITWDAQPGRIWKGKTEILPKAVVARGSRSVGEVLCSVQNEKLELLPNTNVNVVIRVRERGNALVVPRGSVRSDGAQRFVFVLDGEAVHRRDVRVGIAGATKYEILEGLKEGERVAQVGDVELRDGLAVRAVDVK
jgi:HlyD family secretion protein